MFPWWTCVTQIKDEETISPTSFKDGDISSRNFSWVILESNQVKLFQHNLVLELSKPLNCQCLETFDQITKKGLALESFLLEEGTLKHYQKSNQVFS